MNNLEPRAKIGDVVIVANGKEEIETKVRKIFPSRFHTRVYYLGNSLFPRYENQILKNLTTNISYEEKSIK